MSGRTRGEKESIEDPDVLKDRPEPKGEVRVDKGLVGKGTPIKGDNKFGNGAFDHFPNRRGENVVKSHVREDGDNEDIDIEDTIGKREIFHKTVGSFDAREGSCERSCPDVIKGDRAPDNNTQVSAFVAKGEVGPWQLC